MSQVARQAARGTALLAAAHGSLTLSGFLVALLLARGLGPESYGIYGIIYSFLLTSELIGRLGIPQAVSRLIAERGAAEKGLEACGVTLTMLVYAGVFALFWAGAPWVAGAFELPRENGAALLRLAALDIPFYGLFFILGHILNGRRDFMGEAVATIVYSVAKALGVVLLFGFEVTIGGALLVNAGASALGVAFACWRTGAGTFALNVGFRRPILALAVPVALATTGNQLLQSLDLWALNAFGDHVLRTTKGLYVAATNLARMPGLVAFVMTAVLVPSIVRARADGDTRTVSSTICGASRFMAIVLLPVTGIVAFEGGPILSLLFSPDYAAGAPILAVLVVAHGLLNTAFFTLCGVLLAVGDERSSAVIALSAASFAALLAPVLVALFGAGGAAAGALATAGMAALATGAALHRRVGWFIDGTAVLRALLLTGLVCAASMLWKTEGLYLLLELVCLGLAYLAALPLVRLVTRADLDPFLPQRPASNEV
ncbi:lipopolysaccharide biosynthesis protein [Marinimicrococcus flavescens]|uniref:Oligosaccharide flippase family protein n=1 Tax=Marinimicrococcus flavescens TaxID=3031815 RepID=A0AAP4D6C8_9PROT|nr:oligosaccharide flippase family protein [Marinimicrococcus flavescens]